MQCKEGGKTMKFPRDTQCGQFKINDLFVCENDNQKRQFMVINEVKFYTQEPSNTLFIDFLAGNAVNVRTFFQDDTKDGPEWVSFKLILKDGWVTCLRI